jgi:hypothetical protein
MLTAAAKMMAPANDTFGLFTCQLHRLQFHACVLTSFKSRLILRALELDKLTVVDSKAQSSSTVSMLHVLVGEVVLLLLTCCTCAEGPSEALAEMCVCTARCGLRLTGMVVKLSCCLPEHEGGHGPRTKLSRHKPLTMVCMVA